MAKKHKFNLTQLVHDGFIKDGETLYFVSDPSKTCTVLRQPNHEYKLEVKNKIETVHSFITNCLGQDPPDHATKWVRNGANKTVYDLWQENSEKNEES
jgi:hypothetical protein